MTQNSRAIEENIDVRQYWLNTYTPTKNKEDSFIMEEQLCYFSIWYLKSKEFTWDYIRRQHKKYQQSATNKEIKSRITGLTKKRPDWIDGYRKDVLTLHWPSKAVSRKLEKFGFKKTQTSTKCSSATILISLNT